MISAGLGVDTSETSPNVWNKRQWTVNLTERKAEICEYNFSSVSSFAGSQFLLTYSACPLLLEHLFSEGAVPPFQAQVDGTQWERNIQAL